MYEQTRTSGRWRSLGSLVLVLVMLLGGSLHGQTVTGTNAQSFGTLYRSSSSSVAYSSGNAATFTVTGKKGNTVRMTVSFTHPARIGGGGTATLAITNSNCAYSRDDGASWTTFSTGTLYQDASIPNQQQRILVRVGGTLTSGATSARGNYSGTVTLTAVYR